MIAAAAYHLWSTSRFGSVSYSTNCKCPSARSAKRSLVQRDVGMAVSAWQLTRVGTPGHTHLNSLVTRENLTNEGAIKKARCRREFAETAWQPLTNMKICQRTSAQQDAALMQYRVRMPFPLAAVGAWRCYAPDSPPASLRREACLGMGPPMASECDWGACRQ